MPRRRSFPLFLFAALALWCGAAAPASHAGTPPAPALSPGVATLAASVPATTRVPVVVYGTNLLAANAAVGATVRQRLSPVGGESVSVAAGSLAALAGQPGVSDVETDPAVHTTGSVEPTESTLSTIYPVVDGAPRAWSAGVDGRGVGIAVIDSGVTPVDDLAGRVEQVALPGQLNSLDDLYGHGTFVAAVAAGKSADGAYAGIAPGAAIYALNLSRPDGIRSSDVMAALFWVLRNADAKHIGVVNLSLSESVDSSYQTSALDDVVEMLWRRGIVVVSSAGNNGPGTTSHAPANDPFAITVGATDTSDTVATADDTVAAWSSTGVTSDGFAKPELLAPGRHVIAREPVGTTLDQEAPAANHVASGYLRLNGTSFSAPQVAAAAALVRQAHPGWNPDQVKWVLMNTGRAVGGAAGVAVDVAAAALYTAAPGSANAGIPAAGTAGAAPAPVVLEQCVAASAACNRALGQEAAAQGLETARQWQLAAASWDRAAASWDGGFMPMREAAADLRGAADEDRLLAAAPTKDQAALALAAAGYWQAASDLYARAASWDVAATSAASAAADYAKAASWDRAAASWDGAAADWAKAASWDRAAASWDEAAADWTKAASWDRAAASWDLAAVAWARAASWDNAATDWQKAASWDTAASWDNAASWDSAASWDHAASWDEARNGD
ncbi:MAG: S8 family serine peptidase [Gaiellaceae bacterium]